MRGKKIAATLALVTALAFLIFSTPQNGVSAYSTDKRITILDASYFEQSRFQYSLPLSLVGNLKLKAEDMLSTIGIKSPPWKPAVRKVFKENGPALVVLARLNGDVGVTLHLVANNGGTIIPGRKFYLSLEFPTMGFKSEELLIFDSPFTNGDYHLQYFTETNDLAIIRVR